MAVETMGVWFNLEKGKEWIKEIGKKMIEKKKTEVVFQEVGKIYLPYPRYAYVTVGLVY